MNRPGTIRGRAALQEAIARKQLVNAELRATHRKQVPYTHAECAQRLLDALDGTFTPAPANSKPSCPQENQS